MQHGFTTKDTYQQNHLAELVFRNNCFKGNAESCQLMLRVSIVVVQKTTQTASKMDNLAIIKIDDELTTRHEYFSEKT